MAPNAIATNVQPTVHSPQQQQTHTPPPDDIPTVNMILFEDDDIVHNHNNETDTCAHIHYIQETVEMPYQIGYNTSLY